MTTQDPHEVLVKSLAHAIVNTQDVELDQQAAEDLETLQSFETTMLAKQWNEQTPRHDKKRIEDLAFAEVCAAIGGVLRLMLLDCTPPHNANVRTGRIESVTDEPYLEVVPDEGSPADTRGSAEPDGLIRVYGEEIAEQVSARCGVEEELALSIWRHVTARLADAPNILPGIDVEQTEAGPLVVRATPVAEL